MRIFVYVCITMFMLPLLFACDELSIIMSYKSALYVEGKPEFLDVQKNPSSQSYTSSILTNSGWTKMFPYCVLPQKFAVQTGLTDRVQIIMEDEGILDVHPGSLLVVSGAASSNVQILQGRCAFVPLSKALVTTYASLQSDTEREAFLAGVKRAYFEDKNGMYFAKNPFSVKTSFSAQAVPKGRSFAIIVDSNRILELSNFKLDRLQPSFTLVRTNGDGGMNYRYMAVTGIDIYENTDNMHFTAEARDRLGNWVKMRTYIPGEAWRYVSLTGNKLAGPKITADDEGRIFERRFRAELTEKMKDPVFKREYQTKLEQQNRQIGFHLKSQQVWQQSALIRSQEPVYTRIFATSNPIKYWQDSFVVPTSGVVTSSFGHYRSHYGGSSSGAHRGIDIANVVGTDIHAPNAGKVVFIGHTPDRGNNIVIDHGLGVYTCFLHLAEIYVVEGDELKTGDVVATMGNTGLSTGSHLHWEMVVNGRRVNPLDWTKTKY